MRKYVSRALAPAVAALWLTPLTALAQNGPADPAEAELTESVLAKHWGELFSVPMVPLWLCSLVLITLIFERASALRAKRVLDDELPKRVGDLLAAHKIDEASKVASQSQTVVGDAWEAGLRKFRLGGLALHDALTESTVMHFKPLKRNLQGISTVAVISPLLGLLGTVFGMILVFNVLTVGADIDKGELAEGIMVALFTTIFGLVIAIPGIVAGRYLSARIVKYAEQTEADIDEVAWQYAAARKRAESDTAERGSNDQRPAQREQARPVPAAAPKPQ
ncbi:MAG: MotA/TolQ/ExbB proton channel family protein [Phycisphaeraceae bacterium]